MERAVKKMTTAVMTVMRSQPGVTIFPTACGLSQSANHSKANVASTAEV